VAYYALACNPALDVNHEHSWIAIKHQLYVLHYLVPKDQVHQSSNCISVSVRRCFHLCDSNALPICCAWP
jgi:hypothetical protein